MRSGSERATRRGVWLLAALLPAGAYAESTTAPAAVAALVEQLATCTAYYLNAANVGPMREYEGHYGAAERTRNRALRYLGPDDFDRLVGDAATEMTALTGGDWRHFGRVEARYGAACGALDEIP